MDSNPFSVKSTLIYWSGLCENTLNVEAVYLCKTHSRIVLTFEPMASNESLVGQLGILLLDGESSWVILSFCECSLTGSFMFELTTISECWRGGCDQIVVKCLLMSRRSTIVYYTMLSTISNYFWRLYIYNRSSIGIKILA